MKPGTLLISQPFLGDPHFERSVVLLCRYHAAEGAFGLVLTRSTPATLGQVLERPPGEAGSAAALPLYVGGPVQPDTLHFLHQHAALPGAQPLGQNAFWSGDFEVLISLINSGTIAPSSVRLFVGYSGWSAGQLEEEIGRGSWIRQPASAGKVFTLESDAFWRGILREKGGRFRALSQLPARPPAQLAFFDFCPASGFGTLLLTPRPGAGSRLFVFVYATRRNPYPRAVNVPRGPACRPHEHPRSPPGRNSRPAERRPRRAHPG